MKPNLVLSLCGTSCLANAAGEHRALVIRHGNAPSPDAIPAGDGAVLERVIRDAGMQLGTSELARARRMSAEINSLAAFYEGDFSKGGMDQHFLVHTDTWLGREAAECVKRGLESLGVNGVQLASFGGLRTDSMENFRAALGALARWCEENIPEEGMHVVFNLTGGFKSVQGFMQTLGLFYAHERIYLFEGSDELLRIPRLPVRMDAAEEVKRHLKGIRRLAMGLPTDDEIPDLYLLEIGSERALSEWGELVWQQEKPGIYRERLWPEASPRYHFAPRFRGQVESLPADRRMEVNQRMDELAANLELPSRPNPKSLNFKALQGNPYPPCTHELRAWSDGNASRIFGFFDGDVFVLDRLEKHL